MSILREDHGPCDCCNAMSRSQCHCGDYVGAGPLSDAEAAQQHAEVLAEHNSPDFRAKQRAFFGTKESPKL